MKKDVEQRELLKKIAKGLEYVKRLLSESKLGDSLLTTEEEKEVEETLEQEAKGELLTMKEIFDD